MDEHRQSFRNWTRSAMAGGIMLAAFAGCEGEEPASAGASGTAGDGGGTGEAGAGTARGNAGTGQGGSSAAGAGATGNAGSAGDGAAPGGAGGSAGASDGAGGAASIEDLAALCVYDDDVDAAAGAGGQSGAGGAGGAAADTPTIDVKTHPILGQYLVDADGRTLYTVGRDSPGDCENEPLTDCVTAPCPVTWPPFYAGERVLAPGLDDALFGTFMRPDGEYQTTYYGWPLYYYKTDTAAGMVEGQGKQGLWHAAEVKPARIVTKRVPGTTTNYLATTNGRALYVHLLDTLGTSTSPPMSACSSDCLAEHPPLLMNQISVVSSLEPEDFTLFSRADGAGLQIAYKGAPLYFDVNSKKPGSVVDPLPENWGLAVK